MFFLITIRAQSLWAPANPMACLGSWVFLICGPHPWELLTSNKKLGSLELISLQRSLCSMGCTVGMTFTCLSLSFIHCRRTGNINEHMRLLKILRGSGELQGGLYSSLIMYLETERVDLWTKRWATWWTVCSTEPWVIHYFHLCLKIQLTLILLH